MPIEVKHATYTYMPRTPFERTALDDVSLTIEDGLLTAIAGHTGSGKSTLVQHLNGLLHPTGGKVLVDGCDLAAKDAAARLAKRSVGMVFQYPEHQIFEETVEAEVAFGPKNFGLSAEEVTRRVKSALDFVKIDYDEYRTRSPFELSGGQMRRVAIAGVLALEPKYLVLDEPTAGLDPKGREEFLRGILRLRRERKLTIVLVSHNMDDIARVADKVVFMGKGRVLLEAPPKKAFFAEDAMREAGLDAPGTVTLLKKLAGIGLAVEPDAFSAEEAAARIFRAMGAKGGKKRC